MIWIKMLLGVLLAVTLGLSFHRSWRLEHGPGPRTLRRGRAGREISVFPSPTLDAPIHPGMFPEHGTEPRVESAEPMVKNTELFTPPTALFWILPFFLVLFVRKLGMREGLFRFAALAVDLTIFLSAYFALLLLVLPLLRKRFSARACAVLWVVPTFMSLYAWDVFLLALPLPRLTLYLPRRAMAVIGAVWFAGFLAVGGYYLISHLRFRRWVLAHSEVEWDVGVREIWTQELKQMDFLQEAALLRGDVSTPFSMGSTKRSRCTVLPRRDYTPEELIMIFRHELHHLQRNDVDTKVFLCLCNALCWFHPLVWIATRKAAQDLERSCDEIVTEGMSHDERLAYANLLLDAAAPSQGCTTCLSAAAGTLRYRLQSVMEQRRRLVGTLLLMAVMFGCVMCYGLVSVSDARGTFASLILTKTEEAVQDDESGVFVSGRQWDYEALYEELSDIELEHLSGLYYPQQEGEQISFLLGEHTIATLTDQVLEVREYHKGKSRTDFYLVKSPVDWDALRACEQSAN